MKLLLSNNSQDFHSYATLNLSSTKSIEKYTFILIHDLFSSNNTSHRESITHTFCHSNDIRFKSSPSMSPEFLSNSTKTSLYFISNHNTSIFSDKLSDSFTISFRNRINTSYTLNRFKEHTTNFSTNCRCMECFFSIF